MIRVAESIRVALAANRAVVALESSVFAQGLPEPANRHAASRMIQAIEARGAAAAVTAVVAGVPTLGVESNELERFLRREGGAVAKVSARDLAVSIARHEDGATTVASSLVIASQANVDVFATGGIGGVHRELPGTEPGRWVRDESADLLELSHTPMVVVCTGAKSILDLPATWERLDTLGIPVVGYRTDELPGFFFASTGIPLSVRADSADEIAEIFFAHRSLRRKQALLVVQPPPAATALDRAVVDEAVTAALHTAGRQGVHGSAVTPFLLAAVSEATGGGSLAANLSLLEQNAALAAEVATLCTAADSDGRRTR